MFNQWRLSSRLMTAIGLLVMLSFGILLSNHANALQTSSRPITALDMNSNGKLAVGGEDGIVEIFDNNGNVTHTFNVASLISSVQWNPSNTQLAASTVDGYIWVWDVTTGATISSFRGAGAVGEVSWNASGSLLAGAAANGFGVATINFVGMWDPTTGTRLKMLDNHTSSGINTVDWYPLSDSRSNLIVAGTSGGKILIWDASATGSYMTAPLQVLPFSSTEPITSIKWRPDGTEFAAVSYWGHLGFWDGLTYQRLRTYTVGLVVDLNWSPAGTLLALTETFEVEVIDAQTGDVYVTSEEVPWHLQLSQTVWNQNGESILYGAANTNGESGSLATLAVPTQTPTPTPTNMTP
jgi:WD40 repeat protein